jgi:hypothetical protein
MLRVIEDLAGDWRRLDERIDALSEGIMTVGRLGGCLWPRYPPATV